VLEAVVLEEMAQGQLIQVLVEQLTLAVAGAVGVME
jgi:hypothetical protein